MDYKCPDCGNYMEEATICLACFEKAEKRIGQLESAINEAIKTNGYKMECEYCAKQPGLLEVVVDWQARGERIKQLGDMLRKIAQFSIIFDPIPFYRHVRRYLEELYEAGLFPNDEVLSQDENEK